MLLPLLAGSSNVTESCVDVRVLSFELLRILEMTGDSGTASGRGDAETSEVSVPEPLSLTARSFTR